MEQVSSQAGARVTIMPPMATVLGAHRTLGIGVFYEITTIGTLAVGGKVVLKPIYPHDHSLQARGHPFAGTVANTSPTLWRSGRPVPS